MGYKSDIWGLGAIMLRMLVGIPPFAGVEKDAIEAHVCDEKKPPHIDASVHPGLAEIIASCLQYNPGVCACNRSALRVHQNGFMHQLECAWLCALCSCVRRNPCLFAHSREYSRGPSKS